MKKNNYKKNVFYIFYNMNKTKKINMSLNTIYRNYTNNLLKLDNINDIKSMIDNIDHNYLSSSYHIKKYVDYLLSEKYKIVDNNDVINEIIVYLINKGLNINIFYDRSIIYDIYKLNEETIKLAIDKGYDINATNYNALELLLTSYKFINSNKAIYYIELLIKYGLNINYINNDNKNYLFILYTSLIFNEKSNKEDINYINKTKEIAKLLINNNININHLDNNNDNILYYVNDKEVAELLINKGINIHNKNKNGENALFNINNKEMIELLMNKGIDVHNENNNGETALFYKISKDKIDILLNNGLDINKLNKNNENALFKLIINESVSIDLCKYLIKKGININQLDKKKENVLFKVTNDFKLFKFLIKYGININQVNKYGKGILGKLKNIQYKHVEILLKHNLIYNQTNKSKHIFFDLIKYKYDQILSAIIKFNNEYNLLDNTLDNKGQNILFHTLFKKTYSMFMYLISLDILNINCVNNNGDTLLHLAIKKSLVNHIIFLLNQPNIDLSIKDKNDKTALDLITDLNNSGDINMYNHEYNIIIELIKNKTKS